MKMSHFMGWAAIAIYMIAFACYFFEEPGD